MLPTIDLSLIGVLLAVWNVIKIIWDYTSRAFNWIMHRALALFIGSKFWATAAFFAAALVLINFFSTFLSNIILRLESLVFSESSIVDSDFIKFLGLFIDGEDLLSVLTYCMSSWIVYNVVISLDFTRRAFQRVYTILSQGWKT